MSLEALQQNVYSIQSDVVSKLTNYVKKKVISLVSLFVIFEIHFSGLLESFCGKFLAFVDIHMRDCRIKILETFYKKEIDWKSLCLLLNTCKWKPTLYCAYVVLWHIVSWLHKSAIISLLFLLLKLSLSVQYRYDIIMECWDEDPEKRPTLTEILVSLNTFTGTHDKIFF